MNTNILISVILFPSTQMNELVRVITNEHKLVLSSFVIDELMVVVKRKFKKKEKAIDQFLSKFPYEMVYTPKETEPGLFEIRDDKDYPIIYTAIIEDIDTILRAIRISSV